MATAQLIINAAPYAPKLTRSPNGLAGHRFYLVNGAAGIEECLSATGLPAQGAAWGLAPFDKLYAREFDPVLEGGLWAAVRVTYAENTGGGAVTPTAGYALTTTIEAQSTSETVTRDITGTVPLGENGTTKLLTAISLETVQYFANAAAMVAVLPAVIGLCNEPKLNAAAIVAPNLFDSGVGLAIGARQALYYGFAAFREGTLYGIRHRLHLRRNTETPPGSGWDWSGQLYDDDLQHIGSFPPEPVYEDANFVAVFG